MLENRRKKYKEMDASKKKQMLNRKAVKSRKRKISKLNVDVCIMESRIPLGPVKFHVVVLVLPHDKLPRGKKIYKYALTVVDIASRYKEAEPLTSKNSDEVVKAFQSIYRRSPLTWPQMLQVDPGREFMGAVTKEMEKQKTYIRPGRTKIHRDQAVVERFNRTLAERLFGHQYAVEMLLPEGKRSTEWVKRLPDVVSALNNEVTSLIGKKPAVAIKEKSVSSMPSTKYNRPVGAAEKKTSSSHQCEIFVSAGRT